MRTPIAAANWKMNGRNEEVVAFVKALSQVETSGEKVFAPPYAYLSSAQAHNTGFALSSQNVSEQKDGAFTGEISAPMLSDIGCKYVIVGHSERRAIYGETDEVVFDKVKAVFESGLTPILCIGETDEENQQGKTEEVLAKQLQLSIDNLSDEQKQKIVIAYEPVWAIGTGRTPSTDDIQVIHEKIRLLFSQNDARISDLVRILYGGSVKPNNAKEIFALPDVDGGLVGGASLTIESFEQIIKAL